MKGIMSILLVLVFLSAVLFLLQFYLLQAQKNSIIEMKALFLEKNYYKQLELKHAILDALSVEAGKSSGREDALRKASERLVLLEEFAEDNASDGFKFDFWCGSIASGELQELPNKMIEAGKPLKCGNCWDFSEWSIQADAGKRRIEPVRKCASFLDANPLEKKIGVSMGGLELTADASVQAARWAGRRGFGVSILNREEGYAAIAFIPEGTWAEYG